MKNHADDGDTDSGRAWFGAMPFFEIDGLRTIDRRCGLRRFTICACSAHRRRVMSAGGRDIIGVTLRGIRRFFGDTSMSQIECFDKAAIEEYPTIPNTSGVYEVTRLCEGDDCQYRIKDSDERHEGVVKESQLNRDCVIAGPLRPPCQ
jgi:hypothetical protein